MRNWMTASSKSIMARIQQEIRLAGSLSCKCEHAMGRKRKTMLEKVTDHFLGAYALIAILKKRCANSVSTGLAVTLEKIELWLLTQFNMICACQKVRIKLAT